MTTIRMTPELGRPLAQPVRASVMRKVLLACGALASLLYVTTDVLGGLRYEGYSFTSQAVSELMAVDAPSERFVDPLFMIYNVLMLAFGVVVFREGGARRSSALKVVGAMLMGLAAIGFTGPTLFEMHQRGAVQSSDAMHLVITAACVLFILVALGFGAFALGKAFRAYSLGTLVTVIVSGAMTIPFASQIAAGQPTPGFGVIERISIYAFQLWAAVLGIAMLRRPRSGDGGQPQ